MTVCVESTFPFDLKETMRSGLYICGTRQSGKTNLGKLIASRIAASGAVVYVMDSTRAWFDVGFHVIPVNPPKKEGEEFTWKEMPTVFDTTTLYPHLEETFSEMVCRGVFDLAAKRGKALQPKAMIVFEEAHMMMPLNRLHSEKFKETKRFITKGANFNLTFMAITQFSSMIDKLPVKAAQQRYFGRTSEPNDLRYLRAYLGDRVKELETLKVGEFLYNYGKETRKIYCPLFRKPEPYQR